MVVVRNTKEAVAHATRELAGTSTHSLSLRIARFTGIGILPLIMALIVLITVRIVDLL